MMDRSRDSRKRFLSAGGGALVLALVVFFGSPLAPSVRGIFSNLLAARQSADQQALYGSLSRDALVSRLSDAENELALVKYQSVLYGLLVDENAKLREALHAGAPAKSVLARVLERPPKTAYDTLLVDQGSAEGVQAGDLVESQGVALGKVVSSGSDASLVQLFSSSGTEEDVILGTPAAIAVAHGAGGGAYELAVPQSVKVSVGDSVRVPGSQSLLLGTVVSISSKPTDASQTVRLRCPVSFAGLDFIEIVSSASRTP